MTANDRAPARQDKVARGSRSPGRPSWATLKRLVVMLGAMAVSFPAFAAGIDSRIYTCAGLQALIAAKGFVFIAAPAFGDFVVANVSYCPGSGKIQLRSVATTDNPECVVQFCISANTFGGGGN
jgi:hypothetical protein